MTIQEWYEDEVKAVEDSFADQLDVCDKELEVSRVVLLIMR